MPADLSARSDEAGLQSSLRGLHVTPAAPLPFLDGVSVRSFLLERAAGNILVYNAPGITAAAAAIAAIGRPDRLIINHWHEAMFGTPDLDVPIFVGERDEDRTDLPVAGTFRQRETIGDDLEVIPTPGHTAGTTAIVWNNGEHRLLFPGDTLWVQGGEWKAVLLPEGDRAAYLDSLALLADVEFDVLVPWGSEDGRPYAYAVTRQEARDRLEAVSDRLRRGGNA